jgi:hypothetical protein
VFVDAGLLRPIWNIPAITLVLRTRFGGLTSYSGNPVRFLARSIIFVTTIFRGAPQSLEANAEMVL